MKRFWLAAMAGEGGGGSTGWGSLIRRHQRGVERCYAETVQHMVTENSCWWLKKLLKTQPSLCLSTQQYISFRNKNRLSHFLLAARSLMLCVVPGAGFGTPKHPACWAMPASCFGDAFSLMWTESPEGKKGLKWKQIFNIVQPLRGCLWAAISPGMDPAKSFTCCRNRKHFSKSKAHKISE